MFAACGARATAGTAMYKETSKTLQKLIDCPLLGVVIGELLTLALAATDAPLPELNLSTEWFPLLLWCPRPANDSDLLARGCRCRNTEYRFFLQSG